MVSLTKDMFLFCLITGAALNLGFLIIFSLIAFLRLKRKVVAFLCGRIFLALVVVGFIAFPYLSLIGWQSYSKYLISTIINQVKNCTNLKLERLRENNVITITNKDVINAIANSLGHIDYQVDIPGNQYISFSTATVFSTYKNGRETGSFFVLNEDNLVIGKYVNYIISKDVIRNIYRNIPEISPEILKDSCSYNLRTLFNNLYRYVYFNDSYPEPNFWCDLLLAESVKSQLKIDLQIFRCEAANKEPCHYAMNPYCIPESPNDIVLLFETKAGWNQHGGAELMAFDHHQPKGCNVLFNDGTVRFITPEEVNTLNWGTDVNSPAIKEE